MRLLVALACILFSAGCTPGATRSVVAENSTSSVVTIDVNLTLDPPSNTPQGTSGGYRPATTTVTVGTAIRFMNSDTFAHTATSLGTATSFPAASPFSSLALQQYGTVLSQDWSSGILQPGTVSQTLIADKPGTYLYGCFFHYGSPMRAAAIVVQ
jgi:plastocyanin